MPITSGDADFSLKGETIDVPAEFIQQLEGEPVDDEWNPPAEDAQMEDARPEADAQPEDDVKPDIDALVGFENIDLGFVNGTSEAPEAQDVKPDVEAPEAPAPSDPDNHASASPPLSSGHGSHSDSVPPPPPPPPRARDLEHVDVDLGALKSVSRNHAKIEYRADLGQFCLEIYGRNGAWVDDRYYVKGTLVPLHQGYVTSDVGN